MLQKEIDNLYFKHKDRVLFWSRYSGKRRASTRFDSEET